MTIHGTSFDELYNTYGALVKRATGRNWWRKDSIQSRPKTPYATIFLPQSNEIEKQVVENIQLEPAATDGQTFQQIVWGTTPIQVEVEFFISRINDTAQQAAKRFMAAMYLDARWGDVYLISALSGGISYQDLSLIFREDTEPRTQVRFMIYANVIEPVPLADTLIYDIQHQQIGIVLDKTDGEEAEINLTISSDDSSQ